MVVLLTSSSIQYIALSHCWGTGNRPFTTTHATFPQRTDRIAFASLPRTFQHAVQATRELGARYLWIDSLCIVQDDVEDWAIESGLMGSIYARSYVTLAADSSGSSEGGLFNTASVLQDEEPMGQHVVLKLPAEGEVRHLYISDERAVPSNLDSRGVSEDGESDPDRTLVTRGWTLQEAILAPRVLHYTSKQLIWECPTLGYRAEDIFSVNLRYTRPTYTEVKSQLRIPSGDDHRREVGSVRNSQLEVLKTWYLELIELRYAARRLTYLKDKLPAIAGLASWTGPALQCGYIAGMWQAELEWALTWRTHEAEMVTETAENSTVSANPHGRPQTYRSPSFSWACSNGQISWDYAVETFERTAQLQDYHVELAPHSGPFGPVKEGCWVRVGGFFSRLVVTPLPGSWNGFSFEDCDGISGKIHMDRVPGGAEKKQSSMVTCFELGLGSGPEFQTGQRIQKRLCLLVLAPMEGEPGCYTRVGLADWAWDVESEACEKYTGLREWRTVTIY